MRLLIIGQFTGDLAGAAKIAMDRGATIAQTETIKDALEALHAGEGADMILVEITNDIKQLVDDLALQKFHIPVVACGPADDTQRAVTAIQAGAKEYIPLPPDPELIATLLQTAAHEAPDMIVRDPAMISVLKLADQVAKSDASILITGASGTGKEVMARYIHQKSSRNNAIFLSINCAAIPENLLESELFGHEKGAFTGATHKRIGKFEEANGGTLLLDEISEMDIRLQAKLLRALQERVIDRVGGTRPIPVDIRILATSNRNLANAVQEGLFREDLLYRLNVVNLRIPSLKDRPGDILELANHFAKKYAEANGFDNKYISPKAADLLLKGAWRGNVRELENTIHRAVLLSAERQIDVDAIRTPEGIATSLERYQNDPAQTLANSAMAITNQLVGQSVAKVEQDLIINTLGHCIGNRTQAAQILGISIRTLRNKLKQYAQEGADIPMPGEHRSIAS